MTEELLGRSGFCAHRRWLTVALTLFLLFVGMNEAKAQPIAGLPNTNGFLREKAQPDECFNGIGLNSLFVHPPCLTGIPKVNQGYIWAMTATGSDVWFGTLANGNCITQGGVSSTPPPPYLTPAWVCEFAASPAVPFGIPPALGDFRPPRIYFYNTGTHALTDATPPGPTPFGLDPAILTTLGIRAAGTLGNVVLLAGPSLLGGLNVFAFQADTHAYLGHANFPAYNSIRQFVIGPDGLLYTAVGTTAGAGAVLKWTGTLSAPFSFDLVGNLDGMGAYIENHKGRLWVTTWPSGPGVLAGLFESPAVPVLGGLTPANANQWMKVWDASFYEPDPVIAATYAGGALASFQGDLYWGTIHIPWLSTAAFVGVYGVPATSQGITDAIANTFRTAVLFRTSGPNVSPALVELLYGESQLPKFTPGPGWQTVPNKMPTGHQTPTFGHSGFGNAFNAYIWSMAVWHTRLWIGTFDWSFPAFEGSGAEGVAGFTLPPGFLQQLDPNFGADLWSFKQKHNPAEAESITGVGNFTNYGVRNMVVNGNLFLGMANPMNLLTSTPPFNGGWELIELSPNP